MAYIGGLCVVLFGDLVKYSQFPHILPSDTPFTRSPLFLGCCGCLCVSAPNGLGAFCTRVLVGGCMGIGVVQTVRACLA